MRELPLARFQTFRQRTELDEIDSAHFPAGDYNVSGWTADSSPDEYRNHLASMGRAIMAGEVSQLKHSFRLHAAFSGDPAALYRDLLLSQRGPHAVCLDTGRFRLVSASPQGFFRRVGDVITVRPILATARRGRWLEEDLRLAESLRADGEASYTNRLIVKEIEAELTELGDLQPAGDTDRYEVERLETVWQLTAELGARLRPGTALIEIFESMFPLASLTGVPKVEAMALLAATEESARGAYCGAIGYLAPSSGGGVDALFNVAVRTVVVDEDEGVAEFGVGVAITNRSEVVGAFEEARLKAKVLVDRRPDFKLFTKLRCEGGEVIRAEAKLARLAASAEYFGYATGIDALQAALADCLASLEADSSIITLRVDREGMIDWNTADAPAWHQRPGSSEVLGVISDHPMSTENVYLFHNTTHTRLVDALIREHPDVRIFVLINERNEVAGAIDANVAVHRGGRWLTPPVESGTVASAFRDSLVEEGEVIERVITHHELVTADDVALLDDVFGWRRAELLG
jgi:para-aminobenzoate synthetase/4-amino-4-deoxychorismate lyase